MKRLSLIVAALFMSLSFNAFAADKGLNVAVVNILAAMNASTHADKINKQLEEEFGPAQTDLKTLSNEIGELEKRYNKDAAIMSENEARRLVQQLKEKQERLKFESYELQRQAQKKQQQLTAPLMAKIEAVLAEIQKEKSYDLILHAEAVLVSNDAFDITKLVTERLNKKK